jgi:hypothetical protein
MISVDVDPVERFIRELSSSNVGAGTMDSNLRMAAELIGDPPTDRVHIRLGRRDLSAIPAAREGWNEYPWIDQMEFPWPSFFQDLAREYPFPYADLGAYSLLGQTRKESLSSASWHARSALRELALVHG